MITARIVFAWILNLDHPREAVRMLILSGTDCAMMETTMKDAVGTGEIAAKTKIQTGICGVRNANAWTQPTTLLQFALNMLAMELVMTKTTTKNANGMVETVAITTKKAGITIAQIANAWILNFQVPKLPVQIQVMSEMGNAMMETTMKGVTGTTETVATLKIPTGTSTAINVNAWTRQ